MADVYLAKLTGKADFAKLAVVKRLKPIEDEDPEVMRMFADEARLCARLNHPSIVQTFEVGEDTTGPFLVMEYLEGQPLGRIRSRAARREKPIPRSIALKILRDTIGALSYAHTLTDHDGTPLRVVHRDVSPENIMVTYAGLTKLVDFGVAKTAASMSRTRAGVLKGKVAYMAPEQARSDTNIDERADVFAIGLLLWEFLTTKRLWEGYSEAKVFERLLDKEPLPRARTVDPEIPEDLDALCAKAMEKEKEDRFATASDLLEELEKACAKYNLHASDRETGQFVASLFEAEREKVKALVSGSMTKSREEPNHSLLPQANRSLDPVPPREESDPLLWVGLSAGSLSNPLVISEEKSESSIPAETPVGVAEATRHAPLESPSATDRKMRGATGAVVVFSIVGLAMFVGTRLGSSATREETTPVVVATQASSSARLPEARAEVSIDIVVKPVAAKIYVDGSLVTNPYHLTTVRADATHDVRAEAEGYETKTMIARWDRDRALDLSLMKIPEATAPASASVVRPAASGSPPVASVVASATPPASPPTGTSTAARGPAPTGSASAAIRVSGATQVPAATQVPTVTPVSGSATATTSSRGIMEVDPTKTKASPKHDKIDTDVFTR